MAAFRLAVVAALSLGGLSLAVPADAVLLPTYPAG
ncbi:hypothetical protein SAMN04489726_0768 [Allokutzneria albata]|uniref:Uncharacterized protein n=1 Tax=Allokutzneria albata TaxID=211114 RepID=A0A1G9RY97_ALLAB|nr:hypothetical protein SAMN04489726_0768 [Allokutzneria albata]